VLAAWARFGLYGGVADGREDGLAAAVQVAQHAAELARRQVGFRRPAGIGVAEWLQSLWLELPSDIKGVVSQHRSKNGH
jgi:hypothetical protein